MSYGWADWSRYSLFINLTRILSIHDMRTNIKEIRARKNIGKFDVVYWGSYFNACVLLNLIKPDDKR